MGVKEIFIIWGVLLFDIILILICWRRLIDLFWYFFWLIFLSIIGTIIIVAIIIYYDKRIKMNFASKRKLFHFSIIPLTKLLSIGTGFISIECFLLVIINLVLFEYLRKNSDLLIMREINIFYNWYQIRRGFNDRNLSHVYLLIGVIIPFIQSKVD